MLVQTVDANISQTPPPASIRVMIVDDHEVIRQGLQRLLERDSTIKVVGAAKDGLEALRLVRSLHPDVVLMDLRMPHMDGITATRKLKAMFPGIKVLILTSFSDEYLKLAFEAGASGYLLKDSAGEHINEAVHQVVSGGCPIAPALTKQLLFEVEALRESIDDSLLTERETEILRSIADGVSQSGIAELLANFLYDIVPLQFLVN